LNKHGGYTGESEHIKDHSININPFKLPSEIRNLIYRKIDVLGNYPEVDGKKAAKLLADHIGLESKNMILGNGATELIYLFARTMKFSRALIVEPTFSEYRRAFKLAGTEVCRKYLLNEKYEISIENLISLLDEDNYDVVVICRPNNPTGKGIEIETLKILINKLKERNIWLFLDESFIEFSDSESFLNNGDLDKVFILHSMTKIYGVPGLRLGYGASNEECIEKLYVNKEPWTLNTFALSLLEEIETLEAFGKNTKEQIKSQKNMVLGELVKFDEFEIFETETNFLFGKMKHNTSIEFQKALLEKGYYIRTCEEFFGLDESFFRIAIRTESENKGLIKAIRECMEELKCQN
jgi:threonine-phosphate decarboxylase